MNDPRPSTRPSLRARSCLPLFVCCVLSAGCTTPPPLYGSGTRSASTEKEATALMAERVDQILAEKFDKSTSPPKTRKSVFPHGSDASANHGGMGAVLFELSVGKDGLVKDVRVLESPNQYLSEDVFKAFKQWEFTPLLVDGAPAEFSLKLRLPFGMRS
jgi:TonB family protein